MQAIRQSVLQSVSKRFLVLVLTNISFSLYFQHLDKLLNIFRFNEPSISLEQALEILLFNMLHYQLYSSLLRTRFVYEHYSIYILCSAVMRYLYYIFLKRYIQYALSHFYLAYQQVEINGELIVYAVIFLIALAAIYCLQRQRNNQARRRKVILVPKKGEKVQK